MKRQYKRADPFDKLVKRFNSIEPGIQRVLFEDAEIIHKKYPELESIEIMLDLFYWFEVIINDFEEKENRKNDIANMNSWFDFNSAITLGYEVN